MRREWHVWKGQYGADEFTLRQEQFAAALFGKRNQTEHVSVRERRVLGRALHFDELT